MAGGGMLAAGWLAGAPAGGRPAGAAVCTTAILPVRAHLLVRAHGLGQRCKIPWIAAIEGPVEC